MTESASADLALTPERLAELEELFDTALQANSAGRARLLIDVAARDAPLAQSLRALLAAHERSEPLIAPPLSPSFVASAAEGEDSGEANRDGLRLGPWAVGRLIGAGGMGAVHEAVRADDEYKQRVAVKFLRRFASSDEAARRFRSERQILASLQHPRIAALLDGGVTPDGQPYFVMEYIDGEPITAWCDARRLDVDARLRLFVDVCDAVRVAHRRLVVHRDLKPSNILVTADGEVKLLDFGIARLLRDEDGSDITQTAIGSLAFTPEYAAPEQMRGEPVSTTADVYALGVLLFELLTGRRPFSLAGLSASAMERVITDAPTPRPSTELDATHAALLGARSLDRARDRLEGDLDAVVGMALRKEPDRRYQLVDALMEDITRYLQGRPVTARPDSAMYRVTKFVRRHRLEVIAGGVAVLSLLAGSAAALQQAARARVEAERATEVQVFLTQMLGAAQPNALGPDARVRDVLDSAAIRLGDTPVSPALEVDLRIILGGTYMSLGEFAEADTQFTRSFTLLESGATKDDHRAARTLLDLGVARWEAGRWAEADSVLQLVDARQRALSDVSPVDRGSLLDLRAQTLSRLGRNEEARPLLYESIALHHRYYPDDAASALPTIISTAVVESELINHRAADSLLVAALAMYNRVNANDEAMLTNILSVRASVLERLGQLDSAEAAFRRVITMRERVLGPSHPALAMTMLNFADHLRRRERYLESSTWTRRIVAMRGTTLDETNPALAAGMMQLGLALARLDSASVGERWVREAYRLRKAIVPAGHWFLSSTNSSLGEVLTAAGRYAEAEALLLPAERQLAAELPHELEPVQDVWRRLAELYRAWGKPDEAAKWQARRTPAS